MALERIWIETIHDECQNISDIGYQLQDLAKAFHKTGNNTISDELNNLADCLNVSSKKIPRAIGQYLHDEVQKGQQAIAETLSAALESGTKRLENASKSRK